MNEKVKKGKSFKHKGKKNRANNKKEFVSKPLTQKLPQEQLLQVKKQLMEENKE